MILPALSSALPALSSALPAIKKLPEAADFGRTVAPYIPQLYTLPQEVYNHITDAPALKHLYLSTNPLVTAFAFAIYVVGPVALIVSEANKNYSQIDRVWSILPAVYNCHYALWAHLNGLPAQRLDHVMALTLLWGARLTFNYWRKGGYQIGSEDYRWVIVRKHAGKLMFLFNIAFISWGQSLLLFLITTPTYILLLTSSTTFAASTRAPFQPGTADLVFPPLIMSLVALEFLADQQQWDFYRAKAAYQASRSLSSSSQSPSSQSPSSQSPSSNTETYPSLPTWLQHQFPPHILTLGFNTTGLFAHSRHPNFAAEQAVWVAFYVWSCCAASDASWVTLWSWAGAGAAGYLVLFQASTVFTEYISGEKYPEYAVYQQRVGRFLPKMGVRARARAVGMEDVGREKLEREQERVGASGGAEKGKGKGKARK